MAKADDALAELSAEGVLPIDNYDWGRAGDEYKQYPRPRISIREAVKRIVFELTLWVPAKSGDEMRKRRREEPGYVETALGHARDANSWGSDNNLKLEDVQVKLDKVLRNQERLGKKLGVEGIER